jgi:hypothetical protein
MLLASDFLIFFFFFACSLPLSLTAEDRFGLPIEDWVARTSVAQKPEVFLLSIFPVSFSKHFLCLFDPPF